MATSQVWITLASMLAAYDIEKATDNEGNPIEPSHDIASSLLAYVSHSNKRHFDQADDDGVGSNLDFSAYSSHGRLTLTIYFGCEWMLIER